MLKQETVDRAIREIEKGYAQYQYFFNCLNSPAWLEPLFQHGFFRQPPKAVHEGQYVTLSLWPESRYLVRMAVIPAAQATVLEIALQIPATENARVHDDLADIALALQPSESAKLVPQVCQCVEAPIKLLLPDKIGKLIVHLAKGGQGKAALTLAYATLALSPDPRAAEKDDDKHPLLWPEPQPRFQKFYYESIVDKAVPALVDAAGLKTVRLCCDLLDDAIELSRKHSDDGDEDYLYIGHPAIEQGKSRDDIPSLLLCATRDAAEQLINKDSAQFAAVLEILESKKWTSFRRLELHLSRVFAEFGRPLADQFFQNPVVLDQSSLRHEAILLLKATFTTLSNETQKIVLSWMDQGPPEDSAKGWLEFIHAPVTPENIRTIADEWRRDHFAILQGKLPELYQRKLDDLLAAKGAARALVEPQRITGGAFTPGSPRTSEEMSQMNVEAIIEFLASWTPGTRGSFHDPTAEGLGRKLIAVVAQNPAEFARAASRFRALDPTYVRSLFTGLTEALKQAQTFEWQPILELAVWVLKQGREIPGRTCDLMDKDPDWGWTRDSIIEILTAGFEDKRGKLTLKDRAAAWEALKILIEDPIPSIEDEGKPHFEPSFLSINSTRGRAFHALIKYAWWVRQCFKTPSEEKDSRFQTFDVMPEVPEALDAHLKPAIESTLTIHSIYGQWLPSLAGLDWEWLKGRLTQIFPSEPENTARFRAAWESFVFFCQPNTTLLPILKTAYQAAVAQIGKLESMMRSPGNPDSSLAEHLMSYYWSGNLEFGSNDHLLDSFYSKAPDRLRGHAMWFVGRSAFQWDDRVPPEVFARLCRLMETRLDAARRAASVDDFKLELANFGWWFVSGKFEDQWKLDMLLSVLQLTKKTEAEMDLVKCLAELCPRYPVECVSCLRFMVEGDKDRWLLVGVEDNAREIVQMALKSNNPEAAILAGRLVEELIARGYYEFRSVLNRTSASH